MEYLIIGGIVGFAGLLGGLYLAVTDWLKMRQIVNTPTSPIKSLLEAAKKSGGAPGAPGKQVEIKGRIKSTDSVIAPMSGKNCVWYRSSTKMKIRKYDHHSKKYRYVTEPLEEKIDFKKFQVVDSTGAITVLPEGANIEGLDVVNKSDTPSGLSSESFDIFSLFSPNHEEKVVANIHEECILPVDHPVYVLGELSAGSGAPFIRRSLHNNTDSRLFLISVKSEEQILRSLKLTVYGASALALLSGGGLIFVAVSLFTSLKK